MPDKSHIGHGTILAYCATPDGEFTPLGRIVGFTPSKLTVEKVALNAFDNPTNAAGNPIEDCTSGWVAPGTYGIKLESRKSQDAAIRALAGVDPMYWRVTKSNGQVRPFQGYVSEVGDEIPLQQVCTIDFTIQINGGTWEADAASA